MTKRAFLALLLSLFLIGCVPTTSEPTPIPIPPQPTAGTPLHEVEPTPSQVEVPYEVNIALMVALEHVRGLYGPEAPPTGLPWEAAYVTPEGLVGSGRYRFAADGWLVDISYPIVAPQNVIYTVIIRHEERGFLWDGTVEPAWQTRDAGGTPTPAVAASPTRESIPTATPPPSPTPLPPTPTPITGPTGTVNVSALNVRQLPDPSSRIVHVLAAGEIVRLTGYRNPAATWVQITTLDNMTGWVNGSYLDSATNFTTLTPLMIEPPPTPLPTATPQPTPTPVPVIAEPVDGWQGLIVAQPAGSQFDDYFLRSADQGRFGLTGRDEPLRQQIASLRDSGLTVRLWGIIRYDVPDAYGTQIEVSYLTAENLAVDGWRGLVRKNSWDAQYPYRFEREDGRSFVLGGNAPLLGELQEAAWLGSRVALTGTIRPALPGLIDLAAVESLSGPSTEARNLTFFAAASASSALPADRLGSYHGWSAVDGRLETTWCEGVDGPGRGEWLLLEFPHEIALTHLMVDVGYDYSAGVFAANNRVKQATFLFAGEEPLSVEFADGRGLQLVNLVRTGSTPIVTDFVKVVIDEVYPGATYDDTCLSEIEVWGVAR